MRTQFKLRAKGVKERFVTLAVMLLCLCAADAQAQTGRPATNEEVRVGKTQNGGAVFKVPSGYMPLDFAEFKGLLMLAPKKPAGMFVAYSNDGETIDALRRRARAAITKMFVHNKDVPESAWQSRELPPHTGDTSALLYTYDGGEQELQMATYERTENSHLLLYGYFAMRNKSGKGENGRFLDEQGKGVKEFDKLWQSFGGRKQ